MKKRITATALLAVSMLLSACGNNADGSNEAYSLYTKANENFAQVESIAMDVDTKMTIKADDEEMSMNMTSDVKQVILSETDIDMEMISTTYIDGFEMDSTVYYTGGNYYYEMMGQKFKMNMDIEQIMDQVQSSNIEFEESAVKSSEVNDVDGGKELSFVLDGEALNTLMDSMSGTIESIMGSMEGVTMSFGDVTLTSLIDDNDNFKNVHMVFTMTMSVEENGEVFEASMDTDMLMEIKSINDVTVDFPDDLDEYIEMDFGF